MVPKSVPTPISKGRWSSASEQVRAAMAKRRAGEELSAEVVLAGGVSRHDTPWGRNDGNAHPAENFRNVFTSDITPETGAAHPLQILERRSHARIARLGPKFGTDTLAHLLVGPEVTLLLENACDLLLDLGVGSREIFLVRHRGILEARKEIRDWIGYDSHGSVGCVGDDVERRGQAAAPDLRKGKPRRVRSSRAS